MGHGEQMLRVVAEDRQTPSDESLVSSRHLTHATGSLSRYFE